MAAAASAQPAALPPPRGGTAAPSAPAAPPRRRFSRAERPQEPPGAVPSPGATRGGFSLCGPHGGEKPAVLSKSTDPRMLGSLQHRLRSCKRPTRVLQPSILGVACPEPRSGETERRNPRAHGAPRRQSARSPFCRRAVTHPEPLITPGTADPRLASNRPGGESPAPGGDGSGGVVYRPLQALSARHKRSFVPGGSEFAHYL